MERKRRYRLMLETSSTPEFTGWLNEEQMLAICKYDGIKIVALHIEEMMTQKEAEEFLKEFKNNR